MMENISQYNEYKQMRNYFFDKGQQLKTPIGQFILAYNKLDSHNYALERLENCSNNYVFDMYSSFEDTHFLRYYTCWEEEQSVFKKVEKEENTEAKGSKKKSMGLNAFLSKKKNQNTESPAAKIDLGLGKTKKDAEPKKQQLTKIKVVYVQLQGFEKASVPKKVQQIKLSMAVVYLLAQAVNKKNGIWPNMIPVVTNEGALKFVKKGGNRDQQLVNLFEFAMAEKNIDDWSKQMTSIYEMYKINGQFQLLGSRIDHDLSIIVHTQYDIILITQGKKTAEKAKIIQPEVLALVYSGYEIPLTQFNVVFSYIDQNNREVTLQHQVEDPIVLIGQSSNFIIRYLKTFRLK